MTTTTTTATAAGSVYATIDDGSVHTVVDGPVTVHHTHTVNPDQPGLWAAVWYEDETYADTCHTAGPGVTVAHYDWALWYADLHQNLGRVDDFDPVTFAATVLRDVESLGPAGARELRDDAYDFLAEVETSLDDVRGLPTLHALARRILAGESFTGAAGDPETGMLLAVELPDGPLAAFVEHVTDTHVALRPVAPDYIIDAVGWLGPVDVVAPIPVTVPRSAVLAYRPGPVAVGDDGLLHYVGDACGAPHEVAVNPTDPNEKIVTCGRDFMAGTICSLPAGHDGPDGATCPWCAGDWVNETCTCH